MGEFCRRYYDADSPYGLAMRMAGYVRDPNYIAAYVAREFGKDRAPSPKRCADMIEAHRRDREQFKQEAEKAKGYNPENDNGEPFRVAGNAAYLAPLKPSLRVYTSNGRTKVAQLAEVKFRFVDPVEFKGLAHTRILAAVAESFGLTIEALKGRSRRVQEVSARQVAIRLLRDVTREDGSPRYSYPQIARIVGRHDHSTVLHAINTFDIKCRQFPEIAVVYERLKDLAA